MSVKKILAALLAFFQVLFTGVSYGSRVDLPAQPTQPVEPIRSISGDCNLSDTVLYAAALANTVQAAYTTPDRTAFCVHNTQMRLTHGLRDGALTASLTDADGRAYLTDTFDAFCADGSGTHRVRAFEKTARINVTRFGQYYDECHVRDLKFDGSPFVLDKTFHVYGDRLYWQNTLYTLEATTDLSAFGSEVRIAKDRVLAVQIRDADGVYTSAQGFDADSVQYAAFDLRDAGTVAFIVSENGGRVTVEDDGSDYLLRQYAPYTAGAGVNKYDETGGFALNFVTFGCRVYTDASHGFDGAEHTCALERTPCRVTVAGSNTGAYSVGYDPLRGCYDVHMYGTDFNSAWRSPDWRERVDLTVESADEREIWLRGAGENGCLEAAAVLDGSGTLAHMSVQVSKNFCGDFGEVPRYYTAKDYAYGDSFSPLVLHAGEPVRCTLLHLYQNWGKTPLKQLSSIEFHTSYFHLSTGVTESNCIAPYFVGNKDGWLLPDFRGRSGTMWREQPQFNSVGVLDFMQYRRAGKELYSEFTDYTIDSAGPSYADVTSRYVSDCDSYTYTLRHLEFPQTDENRTCYSVQVQFNREITFRNFRKDFDLFYFDGRFVTYDKLGYLNTDNEPTVAPVRRGTRYYPLGDDAPYFSFFSVTPETQHNLDDYFGCSFGLVVRGCAVTQSGKPSDLRPMFRQSATKDKTVGVLTLDAGWVTFRPGDTITLDLVLLPWGTGREETDDNVRAVREDAALHPATVTAAAVGEAVPDVWLPRVRAADNTADFTVSGGRNNIAVRVDGFTKPGRPEVLRKVGDAWEPVDLSSGCGYDGYSAFYNPDGTYGYAFVYEAAQDADAVFRVQVK